MIRYSSSTKASYDAPTVWQMFGRPVRPWPREDPNDYPDGSIVRLRTPTLAGFAKVRTDADGKRYFDFHLG